jgi:hypothetical protein
MLIAGLVVMLVAALLLATALLNRMADRPAMERYRRIVETPTTPIAKLATGGLVEIHGRAVASDQGYVTSPVTSRQLLLYFVDVLADRGRAEGGTRYWSRHTEEQRRDFWLDDGSGERAYISPQHAKLVLGGTRFAPFASDHRGVIPHVDVPMHAAPLTQAMHHWATRATSRPDEEHVIHENAVGEGDYVYAIGEAYRQDGTLVLRQTADTKVLVSNLSEQQLREIYESKANTASWLLRISIALSIVGVVLLALHFV